MSARWATFLAVLALAAVHLLAGRLRPPARVRPYWFSAAAGVSIAYVFLHILPALAEIQLELFAEHQARMPWLEEQVYLAALLGLVAMYALDHLAYARRAPTAAFWTHVVAFALYNLIIGFYVARLASPAGLGLGVVAFAAHFFVTDESLEHDYGPLYERFGRPLLSLAILGGWALGTNVALSGRVSLWLFAALAGGILLNALKEELPGKGESKVVAFLLGVFLYSALMLATFRALRLDERAS